MLDKNEFAMAISAMAAVFRAEVKDEVFSLYWEIFKNHDPAEFKHACTKCITENRFFPVPADIISHMPSVQKSGHVGPDEAWAIAEEAMDEFSTVFMTAQIFEAKVICQDLYDSGDRIAARMAFKDAYSRIVKNAPAPEWTMSEGYDKARKADAIKQAVALGRFSEEKAQKYLGTDAVLAITANVEQFNAADLFEKIKMPLADSDDFESGIKDREAYRQQFEQKRQEALAKIEELKGLLAVKL